MRTPRLTLALLLGITGLLLATQTWADIYRCKEAGRIIYRQHGCLGTGTASVITTTSEGIRTLDDGDLTWLETVEKDIEKDRVKRKTQRERAARNRKNDALLRQQSCNQHQRRLAEVRTQLRRGNTITRQQSLREEARELQQLVRQRC